MLGEKEKTRTTEKSAENAVTRRRQPRIGPSLKRFGKGLEAEFCKHLAENLDQKLTQKLY
jgi:hypothetical protein